MEPARAASPAFLLETVLVADRGYMLDGAGEDDTEPARPANRRVQLRVLPRPQRPLPPRLALPRRRGGARPGTPSGRARPRGVLRRKRIASSPSLPDEIDWEDEVRLALEERASFSPDALTGMEASLRCPGPETMESRIFGRLSAWQNWIFQRPNAVGERGALTLYGSGARADFDRASGLNASEGATAKDGKAPQAERAARQSFDRNHADGDIGAKPLRHRAGMQDAQRTDPDAHHQQSP